MKTNERVDLVDISSQVANEVKTSGVTTGTVTVYVPHTTCGVTINESADPDVARDIKTHLAKLVPQNGDFKHYEGNSDSHIKTSMIGSSENIFIENGKLVLGMWQGIFLCDFDGPRTRKVYMKIVEG
ncbi:MAG: secondary thiamine-phosphate synthase enzyme YjbQ [Candidatus Marinimicrobia bacterium]|nr:secondary thiamine-phosphate synthase enzyme YjbQ [Candidatus Neomarinimicrobiota bacterium]